MITLRVSLVSLASLALVASTLAGCSSNGSTSSNPATTSYMLQTPSVTIKASQERYVCYAKTLEEDLAVDRFDYQVKDYVHHLFLSQTTQPEPDGLNECDVVFRTTWLPLFLGGKGATSLEYPAGDANVLPKGTQIVLQLHLVNTTADDKTLDVELALRRSTATKPTPVGLYAFGTQVISLPPSKATSVVSECTPAEDVNAFAMFAHEHQLGTKVVLEAADATGQYKEIYRRDPYDFNRQIIEQAPLFIAKEQKTRITCSYDNTTSAAVSYGESSFNEMCYLAMYVPGRAGAHGCVATAPSDAGASSDGGACVPTANAMGIGAPCTAGGGECASPLQCSSDLQSSAPSPGFCMKLGCSGASDCGGATCCAPAQGGGAVNVCLPSSCVPSDCAVK